MTLIHADRLRRAFGALYATLKAHGTPPFIARADLLRAVDDVLSGRWSDADRKVETVRGELVADTPTTVAYILWMADVDLDDPVARHNALKVIRATLDAAPARPPGRGGAA